MIRVIHGDLLANTDSFDVIAHGCNCYCTMGSGIAKSIRVKWPGVYRADCATVKGDYKKLGTNSTYEADNGLVIINCYTQYRYGNDKVHADYAAIRSCMADINTRFKGKRIGLPKIGCGLAGGSWDVVKRLILSELADLDVTVMWL